MKGLRQSTEILELILGTDPPQVCGGVLCFSVASSPPQVGLLPIAIDYTQLGCIRL